MKGKMPTIKPNNTSTIHTTYNIIIIGAGSAGLPCAIEAAKRGLQVLVIEKESEIGGTLHITAGHLSAGGTKRQKELGIEDNWQNHLADVKRISQNSMDESIAQKACELAPQTLDWLHSLGYPFHAKAPTIIYGHEPYNIARTYFGENDITPKIDAPGKTVLHVLAPIFNKLVADKKITLWLNTKFENVELNESNKQNIVGLQLSNLINQQKIKIEFSTHTKIVLTTGGYASNPNLFKALHGTRLISTAKPSSTGDGLIAAQKIGGIITGTNKHSSTLGGIELEPNSGRCNFWQAWARVSNGVDRKQREIYVNDEGNRFMNEYDTHADEREQTVLQQTNKRFWVLFDEFALHDGDCIIPQFTVEQLKQEAEKNKAIFVANSIKDLCNKTGLPFANVNATISQYNQFVANQKDENFGRTYLQHTVSSAPYYAILVHAYSLISFGGIKVNAALQILNNKQQPFANLYAAGEILGASATSGNAFCGGMLLTPAISFGKWLGENL